MRKVVMSGQEFTKMAKTLGKFVSTNKYAAPVRTMIYIEATADPASKTMQLDAYATDGIRAAHAVAPLQDIDKSFACLVKKPVFLPKASDTVEITFDGKEAQISYVDYGVTFRSPQPEGVNKANVASIKDVFKAAIERKQNASFCVSAGNMQDVMSAIKGFAAGSRENEAIRISIGTDKELILMQAKDLDTLVAPIVGRRS